MSVIGLFILCGFVVLEIQGLEHHSKFCHHCESHTANHCVHSYSVQRCPGHAYCGTQVRLNHHDGSTTFHMGCFEHECHEHGALIGKRGPHEHDVKCTECCHTDRCNTGQCGRYLPNGGTTASHKTTTRTTPATEAATTKAVPTATTHHDSLTTSAAAGPQQGHPCSDDERDGFKCAAFDLFHFCTDPTSFAYSLAAEKCPKHCGFCTAAVVQTQAPTTVSPDTLTTSAAAVQTQAPTTVPPVSLTTSAAAVQTQAPTTVPPAATTTQPPKVTATSVPVAVVNTDTATTITTTDDPGVTIVK